jgi:hypothetical protein
MISTDPEMYYITCGILSVNTEGLDITHVDIKKFGKEHLKGHGHINGV